LAKQAADALVRRMLVLSGQSMENCRLAAAGRKGSPATALATGASNLIAVHRHEDPEIGPGLSVHCRHAAE
jgi:hypothetical protein